MSAIRTVRQLKEVLAKEIAAPGGEGRNEKILDILERLDKTDVTLSILTETLIGASVAKLKKHSDVDVSSAAAKLVKKWKSVAKASHHPASAPKKEGPSENPRQLKRLPSAGSSEITIETECLPDLSKDLNESAVKQLCVARAGEVEDAINSWSRGERKTYTEKVRSLVFNLKKNGPLREQVILGQIVTEQLPKMPPEELATAEMNKERNAQAEKLMASRQLDWEKKNEGKINEICGIKGDLLKASLFTCGRCKSTKTTSTQKQTRSADEPMTVFVLCLNCGNRWKC
ncbi:hypothetical protein THAOC_09547 [Thalassiosira oceanica]|uniref:Uncharacterized protein n=1 Tax=Thalassiosira oceanica TaxID=159749 RepID=K0TFD7_THAOC|nr:hypothetical protein THAOC_09547 [Thalassiosira oceanica]|eukprot:EJK69212.1 hypothetical protein THAOC_09547 [Thalassiosira oceanica]